MDWGSLGTHQEGVHGLEEPGALSGEDPVRRLVPAWHQAPRVGGGSIGVWSSFWVWAEQAVVPQSALTQACLTCWVPTAPLTPPAPPRLCPLPAISLKNHVNEGNPEGLTL